MRLAIWTGFVGIVTVTLLIFMWGPWHKNYSVVVPIETKFEDIVHERYPGIVFVPAVGEAASMVSSGRSASSKIDTLQSPELFAGLLTGEERISVVEVQGYSAIERVYVTTLDRPHATVMYREVVAEAPGGGSQWSFVEASDEHVVFKYNNTADMGLLTFVVLLGGVFVWIFGSMIVDPSF